MKGQDPLEVSDLIVRGMIEHVEPTKLSVQGSESPLAFDGVTARVKVLEVLRGKWSEPEITVTVLHDANALVNGREYVICAFWFKRNQVFVTAPHLGIYDKTSASRWVRYLGPEAQQVSIDPDTLSSGDMDARVARGSLDSLAEQSTLVVSGVVVAVHDSVYAIGEGHATIEHCTLAVKRVLKGNASESQVDFVIPKTREFTRNHSTPNIEVGQEWLLFLQASKAGLYPFAGSNSFLRVEGDKLFYHDVEFAHSYSKTARVIAEMQK
jgi:hypothetical protein